MGKNKDKKIAAKAAEANGNKKEATVATAPADKNKKPEATKQPVTKPEVKKPEVKKPEVVQTVVAEEVKPEDKGAPAAATKAEVAVAGGTTSTQPVVVNTLPEESISNLGIFLGQHLNLDNSIKNLAGALGININTKGSRMSKDSQVKLADLTWRMLEAMPDKDNSLYIALSAECFHTVMFLTGIQIFQKAEELGVSAVSCTKDQIEVLRNVYKYYGITVPEKAITTSADGTQLSLNLGEVEIPEETKKDLKQAVKVIEKLPETEKDPTKWTTLEMAKNGLLAILHDTRNCKATDCIASAIEATRIYLLQGAENDKEKEEYKSATPGMMFENLCHLTDKTPGCIVNGVGSSLRGYVNRDENPIVMHLNALKFWGDVYSEEEIVDLMFAIFRKQAEYGKVDIQIYNPYVKSVIETATPEEIVEFIYPVKGEDEKDHIYNGRKSLANATRHQMESLRGKILGSTKDSKYPLNVCNEAIRICNLYAQTALGLYEEKDFPRQPESPVKEDASAAGSEDTSKEKDASTATSTKTPKE